MPIATICQLQLTAYTGGAEVLSARLARGLRSSHRFVFACLDLVGPLGEALIEDGFTVEQFGRRPGVDGRCVRRLAAFLRRERVDLIHAHQYTPFFYGLAARLLYRRPAILFTEHGRAFPDHPRRKRMVANRILLERRDRVVGVGQAVRQALIRNEGIPAGRVAVIYNGVDLSTYSNGRAGRAAVRREFGLGDDDLVILQVARLDPLKDHATAIRMLGRVVRKRPEAKLVLVGDGPEEAMIRALISRHGLEPHVRLLGLRRDVARLLPAADLSLLSSVSEGIPLALIEAMGASLPVAATGVGGVGEVVVEGRTGLLAPSGDDEALAAAVLRLAGDAELRRRMGRLGRARAESMFSEAEMHAGYLRLYEEMLRD